MSKLSENLKPSVCYRKGELTLEDYDEAIEDLVDAKDALITNNYGYEDQQYKYCLICTAGDHLAKDCRFNVLVLARKYIEATSIFVCFHCNYVAHTEEEAEAHFGLRPTDTPACRRE